MNFRKDTKPRSQEKNQEKEIVLENLYNFLRVDKKFLMLLKVKNFWQNLRAQVFQILIITNLKY